MTEKYITKTYTEHMNSDSFELVGNVLKRYRNQLTKQDFEIIRVNLHLVIGGNLNESCASPLLF